MRVYLHTHIYVYINSYFMHIMNVYTCNLYIHKYNCKYFLWANQYHVDRQKRTLCLHCPYISPEFDESMLTRIIMCYRLFLEPKCTGQEEQVHVSGDLLTFFLQSLYLNRWTFPMCHELPAATRHVKIDCDNMPASSLYAPFRTQRGPAHSENKTEPLSLGASQLPTRLCSSSLWLTKTS